MFIPWEESEGILATTLLNKIRNKLGLSYEIRFYPKKEIRESYDTNDEEFEKIWKDYKDQGCVRKALIKRDENGELLDVNYQSLGLE